MSSLLWDNGKIPRHTRTLSKLLDTPDIKTLGRYILELKQHRENKLWSGLPFTSGPQAGLHPHQNPLTSHSFSSFSKSRNKRHILPRKRLSNTCLRFKKTLSWHGKFCVGLHFTHYTTCVAPNYKTMFFAKRGLQCEVGHWAQVMRAFNYAHCKESMVIMCSGIG
mgnify:CR=1 FL=1